MVGRPNLDTLLMLVLAPVLALQTLWVVRRAIRLPEPDGPRAGVVGEGPLCRLVVLGDSSAAGVGVQTQDDALAQNLAEKLASTKTVHWQLCARNGATAADAATLLQDLAAPQIDIALVVFGVNDVKNMRSEMAWRRDLHALVDSLHDQHGHPEIWFCGVPPFASFPLLPNPLRTCLALRGKRFDKALCDVARARGCRHIPTDLSLDHGVMAEDGFHPGAELYSSWAEATAQAMRSVI